MSSKREQLLKIVDTIQPGDELESEHIKDVVRWIKSGEPLYRISKPDNPPKHLVSYFVVVDMPNKSLLLIDHLKAHLWLPTGGHVEIDEDPKDTVLREAEEELSIHADFLPSVGTNPLFITATPTNETYPHTDVSLWYVIHGNIDDVYDYDRTEFSSYKWFTFDEVLALDIDTIDPQMHRFTQKLMSTA